MDDSGGEAIRVDFSKPMALFPLPGVTLLPHAVVPLHVFEPRYVQMVSDALDGAGQIAMAVLSEVGDVEPTGTAETFGDPPVRPSACVGRIVQHHKMPDGRMNILLQGVCRARVHDHIPADGEIMYRQGLLRPIDQEPDDAMLSSVRERLHDAFASAPLTDLCAAEGIEQALSREEAPVAALMDLIVMSAVSDERVRYRMLSEGDPMVRADMLLSALDRLTILLRRAHDQLDVERELPKGVHLN